MRIMKKTLFILSLALATIAQAGIYRHDKSPKAYKELAAQQQFDCVGMVMDDVGQKQMGSCVLIGSRYVLSAGHVFVDNDIRVDTYYLDKNGKTVPKPVEGGAKMLVNQPVAHRPAIITNYSFRFGNHRYYGKKLRLYQPYLDSLTAGNLFCGDIVLIELSEPVKGITPATLNTAFNEQGSIITGVGFGASGPANDPENIGPYMEKIAGNNVIDKIEGYEVNGKSSLLSSDMDAPGRTDCNAMGSAKPLPLEWGPGGGDSGGGLFRQVAGKWQLVGIITGGPASGLNMTSFMQKKGYYGGTIQNQRVSAYNEWIKETIHLFEVESMRVSEDKK